METTQLKQQVKEQIIKFLNLTTVNPKISKTMSPCSGKASVWIRLIPLN